MIKTLWLVAGLGLAVPAAARPAGLSEGLAPCADGEILTYSLSAGGGASGELVFNLPDHPFKYNGYAPNRMAQVAALSAIVAGAYAAGSPRNHLIVLYHRGGPGETDIADLVAVQSGTCPDPQILALRRKVYRDRLRASGRHDLRRRR